MKAWFAILFSLLVATMQPALMANDFGTAAAAMKCCGTCSSPCCEQQDDSDSVPVNSALPSVSQNDLQFIAVVVTYLAGTSPQVGQQSLLQHFSVLPRSTVPIFQRDCSYLI